MAGLVLAGAGGTAWAHHEADRAARGEEVAPNIGLPFSFRAAPMRMFVDPSWRTPAEGWPDRVMVLRMEKSVVMVYDPVRGETWRLPSADVSFLVGGA